MPNRPALLLLTALVAVLVAACGGASGQTDTAPQYSGIVRTPPPVLDRTKLPDVADGGTPTALRGADTDGILLVYFGFTRCPDVCPTTLADLRTALKPLPPELRNRITVAMVTIDPERDTPKMLTNYLRSFFPDGIPLRTTDTATLDQVVKDFAAAYTVTKNADGKVDVVHSAFLYAIGPDGRLIVQWPFGTTSDVINHDLRIALDAVG
jgi:protein SCO1/2